MPRIVDSIIEADGSWTLIVENDDGTRDRLTGCRLTAPVPAQEPSDTWATMTVDGFGEVRIGDTVRPEVLDLITTVRGKALKE